MRRAHGVRPCSRLKLVAAQRRREFVRFGRLRHFSGFGQQVAPADRRDPHGGMLETAMLFQDLVVLFRGRLQVSGMPELHIGQRELNADDQ